MQQGSIDILHNHEIDLSDCVFHDIPAITMVITCKKITDFNFKPKDVSRVIINYYVDTTKEQIVEKKIHRIFFSLFVCVTFHGSRW